MDLLHAIRAYEPWNQQERQDQTELVRRLESGEPLLGRENRSAHLTASAWVVSPERDRVLMAYHNLYDSWAWLGGHADGEEDLLSVAIREVQEESGLQVVTVVCDDAVMADAYSTAVFVMGREEALRFWSERSGELDLVLYTDEGEIYITEGLDGAFRKEFPCKVVRR